MTLFKKICLVISFLFVPSICQCLTLSLTCSGTGGSWSDGIFSIPVGTSVDFALTPTGTSPYTCSWDFDDVESYKNPVTTEDPSHTFNWCGKHRVWVEVTDNVPNTEKALLIVDVVLSSATPSVDAVSDCSLDNTGASNCTSDLATCITNNYDSTHGLKIEFPSGTYKFEEAQDTDDRMYGILLNGRRKIAIVGTGSTRPTLKFANDDYDDTPSRTWDCFIRERGLSTEEDTHLLVSNVVLELHTDPDNYVVWQDTIGGADLYNNRCYVTVENCNIENFARIGNHSRIIHRKNNITGCGNYNSDSGAIETIRYGRDGLSIHNYIVNGDDGHSHIWYFSGVPNTYIIKNYSDSSNAAAGKVGAQLKNEMQDSAFNGNLMKNVPSWMVRWGAYDVSTMSGIECNNNRFYNCDGSALQLWLNDTSDFEASGNHFHDIAYDVFTIECYSSGTSISYTNNVAGYLAPGGGYDHVNCDNQGCDCSSVTTSGNSDDETKYVSSDPSGWYDANGYLDPGAWEYTPPLVNSVSFSGSTVTISASDGDSGLGAGASNARFPFEEGALIQLSSDAQKWSEIRDYTTSTTWSGGRIYVRVADVDHNWSSMYFASHKKIKGSIKGNIQ